MFINDLTVAILTFQFNGAHKQKGTLIFRGKLKFLSSTLIPKTGNKGWL